MADLKSKSKAADLKSKSKATDLKAAPDPLTEAAKLISEATGASAAEARAQAKNALAHLVAGAAIRGGYETGSPAGGRA